MSNSFGRICHFIALLRSTHAMKSVAKILKDFVNDNNFELDKMAPYDSKILLNNLSYTTVLVVIVIFMDLH